MLHLRTWDRFVIPFDWLAAQAFRITIWGPKYAYKESARSLWKSQNLVVSRPQTKSITFPFPCHKQKTGVWNEAPGFLTDSRPNRRRQKGRLHLAQIPGPIEEGNKAERPSQRHTCTKSRLRRKALPCWCQPPIEVHDLTGAKAQSKAMTSLARIPNRRTGPYWCQPPIEGGQQNANRRVLLPGSKDTHFSCFYLIFAFIFSCNSIWL